MKTVLFIILPYKSHYYPSFSIAQKYRNEGYKVIFTSTNYSKNIISNESFESINIHYLSETIISNWKQFLGIFIKNLLDKKALKQRIKEFYYTQLTLKKAIETIKPNKIYLETNISEYYLFFKDLNIDTELISIYLSTEKKANIPPLNSNFIPSDTIFSKITTEIIWGRYFLKRAIFQFFIKMVFIGKDDYFFQNRICKKRGWVWNDILSKKFFHSNVCKGLQNNILVSPRLEFTVYKKSPKEKFYSLERDRNEGKYTTAEYNKLKTELLIQKDNGIKIIFLAFGTLISANDARIASFIEKVLNIVEKNPKYRLIYAFPIPHNNGNNRMNSFRFDFLPQLDILKYADLMITHGGLGSIKECMDAEVPMLVVPINKAIDQLGNAARIEANSLKRLFLDASNKQIESKINDLLATLIPTSIDENSNVHN
jgi:zeaxanthin glucosyltransferase